MNYGNQAHRAILHSLNEVYNPGVGAILERAGTSKQAIIADANKLKGFIENMSDDDHEALAELMNDESTISKAQDFANKVKAEAEAYAGEAGQMDEGVLETLKSIGKRFMASIAHLGANVVRFVEKVINLTLHGLFVVTMTAFVYGTSIIAIVGMLGTAYAATVGGLVSGAVAGAGSLLLVLGLTQIGQNMVSGILWTAENIAEALLGFADKLDEFVSQMESAK